MSLTVERLKEINAALRTLEGLLDDYTLAREPGKVRVSFRGGWADDWAEPVRQLVLNDLKDKIVSAISVLDSLGFDVASLNTRGVLDE